VNCHTAEIWIRNRHEMRFLKYATALCSSLDADAWPVPTQGVARRSAHAKIRQSRDVDARRRHRTVRAAALGYERPIFLYVGRIAVEKNLEAFLALDLPGSKLVAGDGPQELELKQRFPKTVFLGRLGAGDVAACMAAAEWTVS
jgi:1,2-diacylglycerol 3-alpha-glucosyltransferase/glucuronosyltransferase